MTTAGILLGGGAITNMGFGYNQSGFIFGLFGFNNSCFKFFNTVTVNMVNYFPVVSPKSIFYRFAKSCLGLPGKADIIIIIDND
ncbi:hypothetical protein ES708_29383 [subsurface metagenome]